MKLVPVWKKLLESNGLLSSNIFHTNPLNFPKIQNFVKTYSLIPEASNLGNTNCKGPHTINAANVESTRDLISQKMYRDN